MAGQQPETAGQSFSQCGGDDDIGNVVGSRKGRLTRGRAIYVGKAASQAGPL